MVLSQHRGFRFSLSDTGAEDAPNPLRIAATSTAIAVHAVALLVLLAPVAAPPAIEETDVIRPVLTWPKDVIPPPPLPPIEVPVVRTPPRTQAPALQPRPDVVPVDAPIVSDLGTEAFVPTEDAGPVAPDITGPGPVAAMRLEYDEAPAPTYPRDALRQGLQGVVMLQVTVDVDGRPIDVVVAQSSGHRDLDVAARQQVLKRWRFRPAMKDGRAVQAVGLVPVDFTLKR
ncbi:protein TonB [Luteimonas cucumeris]|uniref:Protein TonB n=1 Tax=Luteimonas cucumeris TaxID=985012 RepID=A0A562LBF6_9GAMM|nr:energy transducer TonB [Luteimonas cucumeris]TWI04948.1 protein TonB [Luteimonas cucumeris]